MSIMTMKPDSKDPCCCSPCAGLETAERPLFGTGQTLTASDLTALQNYVKTKNRLHNRYQHGYGVVCGLEVLCHDCEGSVTIRPGYAIDPCGDDIIVSQPIRYDVIEAIRKCLSDSRKTTGDCDPWVPPRDQGCDDALTHWCIAVRYREVETAVSQRLTTGGQACDTIGKSSKSRSSCGCGSAGSCGCGKCETSRTPAVSEYKPSTLAASNSCAPRRIRECFDVTLIPREEPCTPSLKYRIPQNDTHQRQPLGLIGWLIPEKSLLRNIINCVINDVTVISERLSTTDSGILSSLATETPTDLADSDLDLNDVHQAICHARAAVLEVLQDDYGSTRCQLLRATAEAALAPPATEDGVVVENRADYFTRAKDTVADLVAAWIQAILDCFCQAFLPKCPDDPCDDRVELACISVKAGKILSICNHSCRKYAGAFPSMFYWMSLIPIVPLFAKMLALLCCQPDLLRRNSPLVNDLMPLLDRIDPTGKLRQEIVKDNFAVPRRYVAMAARFANTPVLSAISKQLERATNAVLSKTGVQKDSTDDGKQDNDDLRKELMELKKEVSALKSAMNSNKTDPETKPSGKESTTAKSKTRKPKKD